MDVKWLSVYFPAFLALISFAAMMVANYRSTRLMQHENYKHSPVLQHNAEELMRRAVVTRNLGLGFVILAGIFWLLV